MPPALIPKAVGQLAFWVVKTVQKEVRLMTGAGGGVWGHLTPSSLPQCFWKHQLQPRLRVDSELRCGQSETRLPPGHSDWRGVAYFAPNESPGKAFLRGAEVREGGR